MSGRVKVTQSMVLRFLIEFIDRHGYSPTVREIQAAMDVDSPSTIQRRLEQLRDDGNIEWVAHAPRTIRVVVR